MAAEAKPYDYTNEAINRLMDPEETVWIVQGPVGRYPVLAKTEAEALARYAEIRAERKAATTSTVNYGTGEEEDEE